MNTSYTPDQVKDFLTRIAAVEGYEQVVNLYSMTLNGLIISRANSDTPSNFQDIVNHAWTITLQSLNQFSEYLQGKTQAQQRIA